MLKPRLHGIVCQAQPVLMNAMWHYAQATLHL